MTANKKIVQLSLVSIGLFLILATYFFYPKFLKEKAIKDSSAETEVADSKERNTFEKVEYKGLYDINRPFNVKAEKAYILTKDPNIVYMTDMYVTLQMDDGRLVTITSDNGSYNKISYDCFFKNNVKAVDGETTIFADYMDLLITKDSVEVYNNVFLTDNKSSLRADKIYYDFETKHYQISMFNDRKVKIKLIKWTTLKNLES